MDELEKAAKSYAAEFVKNLTEAERECEGGDYQIRFYAPQDEGQENPLTKIWLSEVPSMAAKCLAAIREYFAELDGEGPNEWGDVISGSEEWPLDEKATAEADISNMDTIAIFADGSRLEWILPLEGGEEGKWEVK